MLSPCQNVTLYFIVTFCISNVHEGRIGFPCQICGKAFVVKHHPRAVLDSMLIVGRIIGKKMTLALGSTQLDITQTSGTFLATFENTGNNPLEEGRSLLDSLLIVGNTIGKKPPLKDYKH